MKHRQPGRQLNRDINHRKALFKNLILSLILTGQVNTTQAKAKAIKRLVDKLITRAKKGTLQARRLIASFLHDSSAVNKLVDDIAPKFKHRSSGFTTLERLSHRRGDNALMVNLKFVDQAPSSPHPVKAAQVTQTGQK